VGSARRARAPRVERHLLRALLGLRRLDGPAPRGRALIASTGPLAAALACAGVGLFAARGSCQDLRGYAHAGWALPTDPPEFTDLWESAPTFGAAVGLRTSPRWELVGSIAVQTFPADEAAHRRDLILVSPDGRPFEIESMDGRDARIVTLLGELRFHLAELPARASPFLGFGAGYFDLSLSPATFVPEGGSGAIARFPEETDSGLAASIGGGVGLRLSPRVALVVDVLYTIAFSEGLSTQFLPIRLGIAAG
jgi:hypothetical protein